MAKGRIFISYRRGADSAAAGRLHDRLEAHFGKSRLFMDVDDIPLGVNFAEYLDSQVAQCDALIAVIGQGWLDDLDRLSSPDDFVRLELEAALKREEIPVIPVFLEDVDWPEPDALPTSLQPLTERHGARLRHDDFARAVDGRLRNSLEQVLLPSALEAENVPPSKAKEKRPEMSREAPPTTVGSVDQVNSPSKSGTTQPEIESETKGGLGRRAVITGAVVASGAMSVGGGWAALKWQDWQRSGAIDTRRGEKLAALGAELDFVVTPTEIELDNSVDVFRYLPDGETLIGYGIGSQIASSVDDGQSWEVVETDVERIMGLKALPDSLGLIAYGYYGAISTSADNGKTWIRRDSKIENMIYDLAYVGGNSDSPIVAVGRDGAIIRSTNQGIDWNVQLSGLDKTLTEIAALGGNTFVAVGWESAITRSTDLGETWAPIDIGVIASRIHNMRVLPDGDTIVALVWEHEIVRSTDRGLNWQTVDVGVTEILRNLIVMPDGRTLIATGNQGAIARSTNAGLTWTIPDSEVAGEITELSILPNRNILVAVGSDGAITRSIDRGKSWASRESGVNETLFGLVSLPDGHTLVAVGSEGTITSSVNGGDTWWPRGGGESESFKAIHVLSNGKALIGSTFGGLIVWIDNRYKRYLMEESIPRGADGDAELRARIAALPDYVRTSERIAPLIATLEATMSERD